MPTSTRDIDVRKICQISVRRMAHTLYNTHMCTSVRAAKSSASPKVATNKILCAARKVFCFCITPSKSNNGHNREHHWDRQWQFTCTMQKFRFYCVGVMGIFNFFFLFFRMDGGVFLNGLGFLVEMSDSVCFYSDSHRRSKTHILQYSTFNVPR